jgi:hypothetical protein
MGKAGFAAELSMTLEDNVTNNRYRSHRSDEIQDGSNLPQTVTLLTTTAK